MSVQENRCTCGNVPSLTKMAGLYAVVCTDCGDRGTRSSSKRDALYAWAHGEREPDPVDVGNKIPPCECGYPAKMTRSLGGFFPTIFSVACTSCARRGKTAKTEEEATRLWLSKEALWRPVCRCGTELKTYARGVPPSYRCVCPLCKKEGPERPTGEEARHAWEQGGETLRDRCEAAGMVVPKKPAPPGPTEAFLYLLMRDHLPWGAVKDLIKTVSASPVHRFTDPHLEAAAIEFAKLLRGETNGQ